MYEKVLTTRKDPIRHFGRGIPCLAYRSGRTSDGARHVKKSSGLLCEESKIKPSVKYGFIEAHPEYAVAKWARMLKISMSGYYSYIRDKEAKKKTEDKYREKIREIFDEGRGTYGVGRVCGLLRKKGSTASYERVKGMMQEMGLSSIHRRKCQKSLQTAGNPGVKVIPTLCGILR